MPTMRILKDGKEVASVLLDDEEVRRWFILNTRYTQRYAVKSKGYKVEAETERCLMGICRDPHCRCHTQEIAPNE